MKFLFVATTMYSDVFYIFIWLQTKPLVGFVVVTIGHWDLCPLAKSEKRDFVIPVDFSKKGKGTLTIKMSNFC